MQAHVEFQALFLTLISQMPEVTPTSSANQNVPWGKVATLENGCLRENMVIERCMFPVCSRLSGLLLQAVCHSCISVTLNSLLDQENHKACSHVQLPSSPPPSVNVSHLFFFSLLITCEPQNDCICGKQL